MVEHLVCNQGVVGSSPFASTPRLIAVDAASVRVTVIENAQRPA